MSKVCPDPLAVATVLRKIFSPGDVFEIRALEASVQGNRRPHTEIGYFDYDHIDCVGQELNRFLFAKGIYYTPNPVMPELLARAANRMKDAGRDPSTKDTEILSRRWLLIDCDPVRPSGISSNDTEHNLAHAMAREIRDSMACINWPQPIYCDSGNGAQLMYRIDLPTDDNDLVKRVLASLAMLNDGKVEVDQSVCNPSRLWRLPGTLNCRGDHTADRPHRLATVIDMPETLDIVTKEQLEKIAANARAKAKLAVDLSAIAGPAPVRTSTFNIDDWISKYCPDVIGPSDWQGGRKWIFPVCPFNESHTNKSAVLIEQASGAIAFRCHHNGCRDYGWKELRELKEPPKQPKTAPKKSEIILPSKVIIEPPLSDERLPDPGPVPETLMRVPGFVSNVMDFTLDNAPYPNIGLAFCGALALQSFLCGRKVCNSGDLRPNIYLLALANSGTGKDFPRKVNARVMFEIGQLAALGEKFASGEGLQDALLRNNALLFQNDEMDFMIRQIKNDPEGKRESIASILMTLYTSAASVYPIRAKAGQTESLYVDQPHVTLFGTATPEFFYGSLDLPMLTNGFFSRLIIIDVDKRGKGQEPGSVRHIPQSIIDVAKWWTDFQPCARKGNLLELHPDPRVIDCLPSAQEQVILLRDMADDEHNQAYKRRNSPARIAWTRTYENAMKLAMLYACSANHENPAIDRSAMQWAQAFAMHQTRRQLFMAQTYVSENPFHAQCLKLIQKLQEAPENVLSHQVLLKRMKMKAKDFKDLIDTLVQRGDIIRGTITTNGRDGMAYRLC